MSQKFEHKDITPETTSESRSYELHCSLFEQGTTPQLEGLDLETFQEVMADERTKLIEFDFANKRVNLPVITPLERQSWFSSGFFENEFSEEISEGRTLYYLATPLEAIEKLDDELREAWLSILHEAADEGAVVIFEAANTDELGRMKEEITNDGISYEDHFLWEDQFSSESHFGGKGKVRAKEGLEGYTKLQEGYKSLVETGRHTEDRENGTVLLTDIDDQTIEELWKIYEEPFIELSSKHPIRQGLTKEEFVSMLKSEDAIKIAHYTDNEIASLCFLVEDLSLCSWLDPDYYEATFPGETVLYFPGIVTDPERQGNRYTENLIDLLGKISTEAQINPVITFETCDSNTLFLPTLIEEIINSDPGLEIEFNEIARHYYHAIKFN